MIWNKKPIDSEAVRRLADRFSLDPLTASILIRRGISEPGELAYYLEEDLRYTHNPFLFSSMETAVDRVLRAVEEEEKILVFGDRDVDGMTSTVILVEALQAWGLDVTWRVPLEDEDYGLTPQAVQEAAGQDITLIITVDCGISNHEEIALGAQFGLETLVLDHHNPPGELPPAAAVVNPKVESLGYPFTGLAGCGVALKLVWALCFSRTPLYGQSLCLINVRPVNQSYIVEAVKMVNLVESDRIQETIVPGVVALRQTRLYEFLQGQQILSYEGETQQRMFHRIFGDSVELQLGDLAPEIGRVFPALAGKSLFRMREMSTMARYRREKTEEIDVLFSLFITFVQRAHGDIFQVYEKSLDLAALGTVADMMPLADENRILVRQGVRRMRETPRPALQEILRLQKMNPRDISPRDLAWSVAPLLNSAGRMGRADRGVALLLADTPESRRALAEEIQGMNQERRRLGDEAWKRLYQPAAESLEKLEGKMLLVADEDVPRGITGILASRLSGTFHVPAVVVSLQGSRASGSLRTVRGCSTGPFLEAFDDLFLDSGGHEMAAGFSLEKKNLGVLRSRLPAFARKIELGVEEETLEVDAELPLKYLNPELEKVVNRLSPYGVEAPPLVFMARGLMIEKADIVGKAEPGHLKLMLRGGDHLWPALFWNSADRYNRDFSLGDRVSALFHLRRNRYQNIDTLQLHLLDIKREG